MHLLVLDFGRLLLCNYLSGIEFDEHGAIRFELFDRHAESEIIQEEKL